MFVHRGAFKYGVSDAVVNGVATPFTTQTAKLSLCAVDGMYGGDIDGTTTTVDIGAMTALKRDGSAFIPASLVNVPKGTHQMLTHFHNNDHEYTRVGQKRIFTFLAV